MKSFLRTKPDAPSSSKQKITVSKRELEQLVEQEVQCAIKQKENNLDTLIETIQKQLSEGMNYETSVRILQSRMMVLAQRAEEALAHIAQNPTLPHGGTTMAQSHLERDSTETMSKHTDSVEVSSVSELMEGTTKEFERLHAENAALKAAFEDIRERTTPSPTANSHRPNGVFEGLAKLLHIKKEPAELPEGLYSPDTPSASVSVKRTKEECHSPEENRNPKRIKSEPEDTPYPPLPQLPFPSVSSLESDKYNTPSRLKVGLALIKNPSPHLSVVWQQAEDTPNPPPMDSYSVYSATELAVGCGVFDEWQKVEEIPATTLIGHTVFPHNMYRPGHKICVSVVAKDKFGRYGPFSEVACARL